MMTEIIEKYVKHLSIEKRLFTKSPLLIIFSIIQAWEIKENEFLSYDELSEFNYAFMYLDGKSDKKILTETEKIIKKYS